ncbi:unnamed protein product [Ixodes hexagonus]
MTSWISAIKMLENSSSSFMTVLIVTCTLVIAISVSAVRVLARWLRMYWHLRKIPQPKERWPFSLALDMWKALSEMDPELEVTAKIFNYFEGMFKSIENNEVTVAYYGPQPFLIATTPSSVEPILNNTQNLNKAFLYHMMKPWIGNGILMIEKVGWRMRRKILTPAFHFRILDDYAPIMNRRAEQMVHKLCLVKPGYFDVLPIVRLAAFGILFETALGVRIDEEEVDRKGLLKVNDEIAASVIGRMLNILHWPDIIYDRTKDAQEFRKNVKFIQEYNDQIVKTRKSEYKMGLADSESKKSFLDILLRMHMEEGTLTEDQVRDEVTSIFIGVRTFSKRSAKYGRNIMFASAGRRFASSGYRCDIRRVAAWRRFVSSGYRRCITRVLAVCIFVSSGHRRCITRVLAVGRFVSSGYRRCITRVLAVARFVSSGHRRCITRHPWCRSEARFSSMVRARARSKLAPSLRTEMSLTDESFAHLEDKILLTHIMRRFEIKSKVPMKELQLSIEVVLRATQGMEIALTPRRRPSASR